MGSEEVEAPCPNNMPKMLKLRHIPPREEAGEVIQLDAYDAGKMVEEMREAAFKLKLYASIIYSTNPRKWRCLIQANTL
jgi:hypothetical protein